MQIEASVRIDRGVCDESTFYSVARFNRICFVLVKIKVEYALGDLNENAKFGRVGSTDYDRFSLSCAEGIDDGNLQPSTA